MANVSASDLRYPVLYFSDRGGVGTAISSDELLRTWPAVVRSGFYVGLRLVEEDGTTFEVTRADVVLPASPLRRWLSRVFKLPIRMEPQIKRIDDVQLSELRAQLLSELEADGAELEEYSGRSVTWWRSQFTGATSISDLVRRFVDGMAVANER